MQIETYCGKRDKENIMEILTACESNYQDIRAFYHSLIDAMQSADYHIGWEKDIYPAPEFLQDSIQREELFIGVENKKIVAAMVLNHQCNDGYEKYQWPTKAERDEVMVLHALGVHPACAGKGLAKQMVTFAIEKARKNHQKALRLDVLKGNVPAEKLYSGMGFKYLHTLPMYYEDTGWTDYELYELRL